MSVESIACVTGASGFIGSHIVDELLARGHRVIGVDNMTTGKSRFLDDARENDNFSFLNLDLLQCEALAEVISGVDVVYHMAANADIRGGTLNTAIDLNQNTIATFNVLEAMRRSDRAKRICFASSAAALGEPEIFPTPENIPIPRQTSLYGASKMACEGLIAAYCNGFGIEGYCFRFVSLLGPRYPHGHVFDFVKKLRRNSHKLEILGDGTAKKSYLHIKDCIRALMLVCEEARPAMSEPGQFDVYHLGMEEYIEVSESAKIISNKLKLTPKFSFGKEKRGWIGDNPFVLLDVSKIKTLGWSPTYNISDSIEETVDWLIENCWILDDLCD